MNWQVSAGAISLVLSGCEAGSGAQVLFSGAAAVALPAGLADARITALEVDAGAAPGERRWRIDSPQAALIVHARALQVHRDAAVAFYRAVPPPRVPWRLRWGWAALLWALRLPGAARLLTRRRGSR